MQARRWELSVEIGVGLITLKRKINDIQERMTRNRISWPYNNGINEIVNIPRDFKASLQQEDGGVRNKSDTIFKSKKKKSASPDSHRITPQHLDDCYCRTSCALELRSLAERWVRGEFMSHPYVKEMSAGEKQLFPGILKQEQQVSSVAEVLQTQAP